MQSPHIESDRNLQLVSAGFGISRATGTHSHKQAALDLSTFDQFKLLSDGFFYFHEVFQRRVSLRPWCASNSVISSNVLSQSLNAPRLFSPRISAFPRAFLLRLSCSSCLLFVRHNPLLDGRFLF